MIMKKSLSHRVAGPMRCKNLLIVFLLSMTFVSCSSHKKLAYDFVNKTKGASVAFYVPEELKKQNVRKDCNINNPELFVMDEAQQRDTIEARTKIVNKINDEIFLDVMITSFEKTLEDYGLKLEYWEHDGKKPDSLHWIVDLSHVEIQEYVTYSLSECGVEGYAEFFPITAVNVASWFGLMNDEESHFLYTEQDCEDYIAECYYTLDSLNNLVANIECKRLTIDDFYNFAVVLGKLYAGYSYDFFMNEYVRKEMRRREIECSDDVYMRYDPYESYIYHTHSDRFIPMEEK